MTATTPRDVSQPDLGSPCGGRGSLGRGQHRRSLLETTILVSLLEDEAHGYGLMDRIETLAGSQMCVDPGSVYRSLRGMEQGGYVVSSWQEAESGPSRRTYAITSAGRDLLAEWAQFLETRAQVMSGLAALAREHLSTPPTGRHRRNKAGGS